MTSSIISSVTSTPKKQKIRGVVRNAKEQDWLNTNPIPDQGEIVYASDKNTLKVGDGIKKYSELPSISGGGSDIDLDKVVNKIAQLPTPSSENVGYVYMYTGDNNTSYTHGYIYECQESVTYEGVIYFDPSNKITYNFIENSLADFFTEYNVEDYENITHGTMTYLADGNIWVIEGKDAEENIICNDLQLYTEDLEAAGFTFIVPMTDFSDGEVISIETRFTPSYSYTWQQIDVQPGGAGGSVLSVNGKTGTVILDASDVGALSSGDLKTINNNTLVGSGNIELSTYLPIPQSWDDTSTTKAFCDDIAADSSAIAGKAYLGEVHLSDMPGSLNNAECVVEIISGSTQSTKTITLTLTSGNVAPYKWIYTYWNNGTNVSGWIGFQTELPSQSGNNNKFLKTDGSAMSWSSVPVVNVENSVQSTSTTDALSANMGKELQDQITNLKARGRYLSIWNCATGLPATNPTESPYQYKTGDYYIVGTIAASGQTNYRPDGSSYTINVPSTTVETAPVSPDDTYIYDGTNWHLQYNTQKTVTFANIAGQPTDNSNLSTALSNKVSRVFPASGTSIYAARSTGDVTLTLSEAAQAYTVAYRTAAGQLIVAETPTSNNHAASKKYVDDIIPCIVVDYSVNAFGVVSIETNKQPTTKTIKEIIGGVAIAGTWTTNDTTHYTFTPTSSDDILNNINGFLIKVA